MKIRINFCKVGFHRWEYVKLYSRQSRRCTCCSLFQGRWHSDTWGESGWETLEEPKFSNDIPKAIVVNK